MTIVREFHEAFGLEAPITPTVPDAETIRLRIRLIREEADEVVAELGSLLSTGRFDADALRRLLKELADLRYVTEGCAVTFGLPIEVAYQEVHRSNMSKLGPGGLPLRRADGKVLKGPNYSEARMDEFVYTVEGSIEQEDTDAP